MNHKKVIKLTERELHGLVKKIALQNLNKSYNDVNRFEIMPYSQNKTELSLLVL